MPAPDHDSVFSLYDLFVVGIGLDLAGATLLAVGLLRAPRQLVTGGLNRRTADYDPQTVLALARDRVDARSGVLALVLGFLVQALAYLVYLSKTVTVDPSTGKVVAAAIQGVLAVALVLGLHFAMRQRLVRKTVVRAARAYGGESWDEAGTAVLMDVARSAGWLTTERHSLVAGSNLRFDDRRAAIKDIYGEDIEPRG